MKVAAPKTDKHELFAAALADAMGEPEAEATTAPKKRAAKAGPKAAEEPKAEEPKAEEPKAEAEPAAEAPAAAAPDESAES
jgi:small subunit ribosomal protein S16